MRVRTWSACVVLAWGILLIVTAVGSTGPLRLAQANTRIASSTSNTSTTTNITATTITTRATLTSSVTSDSATRPPTAKTAATATTTEATEATEPGAVRPGAGAYVVQPGDTLSGIAAALGIPRGWPALYAANRRAVGPDPGLIRPGTVLTLPGPAAPARYTVADGDTLSGIASALGTPGGWPALYAANARAIGPDPDAIRAGTVLAIPRPASSPTSPSRASRPSMPPAPRPASTPPSAPTSAPASAQPPAQATASARGPAPASAQPSARATPPAQGPAPASAQPSARATAPAQGPAPASVRPPVQASGPASAQAPTSTGGRRHPRSIPALPTGGLPRWLEIVLVAAGLLIATAFMTEPVLAIARRRRAARPGVAGARIVLADYDRLVVTHCGADGTVFVLRPPGSDPQAILLAARLVLAQDRYEELACQLGVPAHWPRE
jgi:LysM repeat protein